MSLFIPDSQIPVLHDLIRQTQSCSMDESSLNSIVSLFNRIMHGQYGSITLFSSSQRTAPVMISNNPDEFIRVYMQLFSGDFLMENLMNTGDITQLQPLLRRGIGIGTEFTTEVQRVRPVSDICYIPMRINGYLAGYIGTGRAGSSAPAFSRQEIKLFQWMGGFICNGFIRRLTPEAPGSRKMVVNSYGQILSGGDEIRSAAAEIFGRRSSECPFRGNNQASQTFRRWLTAQLDGAAVPAELTLPLRDRTFTFHFRRLDSSGLSRYFPKEAQAELSLSDPEVRVKYKPFCMDDIRECYGLTPREEDVLRGIYKGFSNKEISESLHINPATVKHHVYNLFSKVGVRSRTRLILKISDFPIR